MDPRRFDSLARTIATPRPRRQLVLLLGAALLPQPVVARSMRRTDSARPAVSPAADCLDPAICAASHCANGQCQCDPVACVAAGGCCQGGWCCASPTQCCQPGAGGPSCLAVDCFGPRCLDPANPSSCGLCCSSDQTCVNGRCQTGTGCDPVACEVQGGCCLGDTCVILECQRGSKRCCGANGGVCCGRGKRCHHGRCRRKR